MSLKEELALAEARVAQLKLQVLQGTCKEVGHTWIFYGGRNAGCSGTCQCSIPVYFCPKCGDCDYGDNKEANELIADCAEFGERP